MSQVEVDEDGDSVLLSEADRIEVQADIAQLDTELASCSNGALGRDLQRERRQLAAELAAGRRLPLDVSDGNCAGQTAH